MKSQEMGDPTAFHWAVGNLFDDRMFAGDKQHGNTKWPIKTLVWMALVWVWGSERGLRQRFQRGLSILEKWSPLKPLTYQGFIKTLRNRSGHLVPMLCQSLRERILSLSQDRKRYAGYIPIAVDGTRVGAPRTKANEQWCARDSGHRARRRRSSRSRPSAHRQPIQPPGPQIWLTVLWHMNWGVLWDWRQGPNGSNERVHLREMFDSLPAKTLLVADAGFQGYEYWSELLQRGHSFLIRVAGQVRLLKELGCIRRPSNIVYLWPEKSRRRHQPPLVLRLIELHNGRRPVCLVTNVLTELTACQMLDIYRQRWGVEIFFRTFKQTYGRSKLLSHAPQNVELELNWSLLGLWCVEFWNAQALHERGEPPQHHSAAGALRVLRDCLELTAHGINSPLTGLASLSRDGYERKQRCIRTWPQKKPQDAIKGPQIRPANPQEREAAKQFMSQPA